MAEINWLNLAGLLFDGSGAILLAISVAFNSSKRIAAQVTTGWGANLHHIPWIVDGRNEALLGLSLMIVGFVLQGVSQFWPGQWEWSCAAAISLLVVLSVFGMFRGNLQRRGTARSEAAFKKASEARKARGQE